MSAYSTNDYEFSFAERTLQNLKFIQNRVAEEKAAGKRDEDITDVFEVTQLINSFVGLLIIPRAKCFRHMDDDIAFPVGSQAEKLLLKIQNDTTICEDTYFEKEYINGKEIPKNTREKVTPKILALRLRNAVSHDRLTIQPLSPGKGKPITGIEFTDQPRGSGRFPSEYFRLKLSIQDVEILVKALSELLLSCYPQ